MPDREKQIAAALFVVTALGFPILFRGDTEGAPTERMGRFMLRSAILEMKLESAVRAFSPPEEGTDAEEGTNAEEEDQTLDFFVPGAWLEATADMPPELRKPVLSQLAVACLAMGLDEEARKLIDTGRLTFEPQEPFAELLGAGTTTDYARFTNDLEASTLPDWVTVLARERFSSEATDNGAPSEERIGEALAPWATRTTLLFGVLMLCFLSGLVLLALSPRILARYRRRESVLERGMFGAPPVYTYLIFAAWFTLSTTLSWLLLPLLEDSVTAATVLFVAYLVSAAVGVLLITKRGMMRTDNLAVAVDLDAASASPRNLALGLVGYLVAVPVVAFLTLFSTVLLGGGEGGVNPAIPVLIDAGGGLDFWLLLCNVALLAPIFEEVFFRGFLFQQFRRFYSLSNAILLSAAVFAAVHLSIESFLPLFGLGVLLATVYHTTRSLWAAVITHGLWNLGTVLAVTVLFGP